MGFIVDRFFSIINVALYGSLCCLCGTAHSVSPFSGADSEPVVMIGNSLNKEYWEASPSDLVAFRYSDREWHQIPIQVDERAWISFRTVYNGYCGGDFTRLDYTDDGTFTGPDPDPLLDRDDEIVFMAKDAGVEAPGNTYPKGTIAATGQKVHITDSLGEEEGYVYLFLQDGSLRQDAGKQYVTYQFILLSGDYKTTYRTWLGPNPEASTIETEYYRRGFTDRWKSDELRIMAGEATGADILDRHKCGTTIGNCNRSEDTFCCGEGAFVINKSGPVRALRSYVGANSGPLIQRQHLFYEQREDITTFVRVHPLACMHNFFDYSEEAIGMTYINDVGTVSLIDGVEDTYESAPFSWELITGVQGSLITTHRIVTDISDLTMGSYYLDSVAPPVTQCTGDRFAYGSSGIIIHALPNTDPVYDPCQRLRVEQTLFFHEPGMTALDACKYCECARNPMQYSVSDDRRTGMEQWRSYD